MKNLKKQTVLKALFCAALVCINLAQGIFSLVRYGDRNLLTQTIMFTALTACFLICALLKANFATLTAVVAVGLGLFFIERFSLFAFLPALTALQTLRLTEDGGTAKQKAVFSSVTAGSLLASLCSIGYMLYISSTGKVYHIDESVRYRNIFLITLLCLAAGCVLAAVTAKSRSGKIFSKPVLITAAYLLLPAVVTGTVLVNRTGNFAFYNQKYFWILWIVTAAVLTLRAAGVKVFTADYSAALDRFLTEERRGG